MNCFSASAWRRASHTAQTSTAATIARETYSLVLEWPAIQRSAASRMPASIGSVRSTPFQVAHLVAEQRQRDAAAVRLSARERFSHPQRLLDFHPRRHRRLERIDDRLDQ